MKQQPRKEKEAATRSVVSRICRCWSVKVDILEDCTPGDLQDMNLRRVDFEFQKNIASVLDRAANELFEAFNYEDTDE